VSWKAQDRLLLHHVTRDGSWAFEMSVPFKMSRLKVSLTLVRSSKAYYSAELCASRILSSIAHR
jgi:hypothetical protein